MVELQALPNEILSLVITHLEHPRDVLHLSLVCRHLAEFAKLDGWKAYLKGRFNIPGLDSDARNTVHGLTTLYRNWQRKGFIAKYLEPSVLTTNINSWRPQRWIGPRGQTMRYRPSIDSYEELFGAWGERREVLAWSAGTQVVVRVKQTGKVAKQLREEEEGGAIQESTKTFDAFRHASTWLTYKIPDSLEGRDDIMSLKLLRPHQRRDMTESMVYGTASGRLSSVSWNAQQEETHEQRYETGGRAVASVAVSSSSEPLIAASLGDLGLSLYTVEDNADRQKPIEPLSQIAVTAPAGASWRIWSCNFLSDDTVALGLGPSPEPIQVYKITPEGLLPAPLRSFNFQARFGFDDNRPNARPRNTTVYPIVRIPDSAQGSSGNGNVFLSGGYDGIIRLHDLRSPRSFDTMFEDITNESSIYSLATQGRERVVAGISMHSMIKVFDLRLSGSHAYSSTTLSSPTPNSTSQEVASNTPANGARKYPLPATSDWNVYLSPRIPPKRNAYREDYWRGGQDSPIYSLSIPSPTSPNIYAGLEGAIQSLTFHSIADPHTDPLLSQSIVRFADSGAVDVRSSYDPQGDALNLGMYEQGSELLLSTLR